MNANQSNLLDLTFRRKRGVRAGAWYTWYDDDAGVAVVCHYQASMFQVYSTGETVPLSPGWGSMSDKCGVGKILRGFDCHREGERLHTYAGLYA